MSNTPHYLNHSLGYLVGRAARVMAIRINRGLAEAGFDATLDHYIILTKLQERGGMQQQDLCYLLGRDKTAVTRLIDSMEKSNWVQRRPDQEDRRAKRIHITEEGSKNREALNQILKKINKEVEKDIDPKALSVCKSVLNQVFENSWPHTTCFSEDFNKEEKDN